MKENNLSQLSLAALFCFLILILSSNVSAKSSGDFFNDFDSDGDGVVSQSEFDGPDDHFNALDQDGSGSISQDEGPQGDPAEGPGPEGEGPGGEGEGPGGGPGGGPRN